MADGAKGPGEVLGGAAKLRSLLRFAHRSQPHEHLARVGAPSLGVPVSWTQHGHDFSEKARTFPQPLGQGRSSSKGTAGRSRVAGQQVRGLGAVTLDLGPGYGISVRL